MAGHYPKLQDSLEVGFKRIPIDRVVLTADSTLVRAAGCYYDLKILTSDGHGHWKGLEPLKKTPEKI